MPSELKDVIPVLTLVVGWCLNEFSQYFKVRREDKKALARALAELLEVHRQVSRTAGLTKLMESRLGPLPPNMLHSLYLLAERFSGAGEDLKKRYDEAVTLVASAAPLLGFQLRSSDVYPKLVAKLKMLALKDPQVSLHFPDMGEFLDKNARERLEKLIRTVAWKYRIGTWFEVRGMLNKQLEVHPELERILQMMVEIKNQNPDGFFSGDVTSLIEQMENPALKK